ncbi:2,4-dichlorophenol 6-monooxygenase [Ensifer adhaerens]|nr:2,4-dichlorophenol 6-monooxygenase [Ensifer adhaerens]
MKYDCDILIAGGGPVGLALAGELGRRSVDTIIIDPKAGFHEHPRATYIGPRTLEYFRAWGIIDDVLAAAVPADYPIDIAFTETVAGEEFMRLSYPNIRESSNRSPDILEKYPQLNWSRYGKIVIGQNILEPVLAKFVKNQPSVRHFHEHTLSSFEDFGDHVVAKVSLADGSIKEIRSRYILGCDGARSVVRAQLGVKFEGLGKVGESVNTFFRSDRLLEAIGKRPAAIYWVLKRGVTGAFLAIDGRNHWVFSRHLMPDEAGTEEDPAIAIRTALGCDVDFTVISSWPWIPRELVATTYKTGSAILVGDAAHLLSPTGGYGLNTGVGDAMNIAWKLQAKLAGWGDDELLSTYESERKPVFRRNGGQATHNRAVMREIMSAGRRLATPADRSEAIQEIVASKPRHGKHFDGMGIYLGDRYDESAIIVPDCTPSPPWDAEIYYPSAKPGGRLPLVWRDDKTTLHDLCGQGFTLFTVGEDISSHFEREAARLGLPLVVEKMPREIMVQLQADHVLVRPDGIICWRMTGVSANVETVLGILMGKRLLADA